MVASLWAQRFVTICGFAIIVVATATGCARPTVRRRTLTAVTGPGILLALSRHVKHRPYNTTFERRLRELGFAEGRNLVIEFRTAQGRIERLPELAADLARHNCDVLLAPETEAHLVAIKQASRDTNERSP